MMKFREKAEKALLEMGMPAQINGFKYVADALELMDSDESIRYGKIITVYTALAEINNTSWSCVERCIRHAFDILVKKGNQEVTCKYFPMLSVTNGNLLKTFYYRLKQEE